MLAKTFEALHASTMDELLDFSDNEALLSARQVVERWPRSGLSRNQLWRWAREGRLRVVRLPSGRVMFPVSAIEELLTPRVISASSAGVAGAGEVLGQPVLSWPSPASPAATGGVS